jgi:lipopolysaccharide export system permease protein
MKKLIFRKILKDILYFFLLVSLSVTLIVWVIQAVNFLDIVSEDGHGFDIYFKYTLLNLPKIFSRIFMFMFFISVFYTILRYENNNELIVFWSNGITKKSFVNVIIIFSLFFSVIQILFTTYFVPISQNKARSYIRSSNIDFFPSLLKEKKFIDTVSNLTIFIEKKNKNGSMEKIFLREDIDKDTSQTIYAKEGKLVNQNKKTYIKLFDGEIINIKNKKINTFGFSETEIDLSKYKTKTTTYPKIQELSTMTLLNCISFDSIKLFLSSMKSKYNCKNNNTKIFFQEFFKRLYLPLYIPLVALVSSIMILYSKDNFRFNKFKNIIFSTGLFLIIVSEITVRYFGTNIDYNVILLFIPLIIFILIYSSIFMFGNNYLKK